MKTLRQKKVTQGSGRLLAIAVLALCALVVPAFGQETRMEMQVVGSGGGFASGGNYTLTSTLGQPAAGPSVATLAGVEAGFWHGGLAVIVDPPGGSFDEWMDSLPPEQQPPPNQRGPHDIPADDGMTNLLKYALGLLPLKPSADAAPVLIVHEGYLGIELERSVDAEVNFQTEVSENLVVWQVLAHTENILGAVGDERERVMLLTALRTDDADRSFLRLRISMP